MKTHLKIIVILFVLINNSCMVQRQVSAQEGYVSFQVFYDQLSPYGQWVNNSDYGYIWIPDAGPDFSPYSTEGHWVMTEYGWTWASDYDWGWAPFHYGRWDYNNYYGWFWVPDNEWGPSWVTWRRGNGYYGWTPMRPGITVSLSFGGGYNDIDRWNFVRERDFDRSDLGHYYVNRSSNDIIIRSSTVINNTYVDNRRNTTYITGPLSNDVQRSTGRRIRNVSIQDNDRPGQRLNNNHLEIYRPRIERISDAQQRPVPSRVIEPKEVKPIYERKTRNERIDVQQNRPRQKVESRQQVQETQKIQRDQQLLKQQKNQRDQQQLEQKQQQSDTRRQDNQQQEKTVKQNEQKSQEVTTPVRSKRTENQEKKSNPPERKVKKRDQGNK